MPNSLIYKLLGGGEGAGDNLDTASGFGGSALLAAPIAAGAFFGYKNLQQQAPGGVFGSSNRALPNIAGTAASDIKRASALMEAHRKAKFEKLTEELIKDSNLDEILRGQAGERNALLATISAQLDDIPGAEIKNIKELLVKAMDSNEAVVGEQAVRIKEAVTELFSTSEPKVRDALRKSFDSYQGVAGQLAAPLPTVQGLNPRWTKVDRVTDIFPDDAVRQGRATKIYNRIKSAAGAGVQIGIEAIDEGAGRSAYAVMYRGGKPFYRHPLEVARHANMPIYRAGVAASHTYGGKQAYADAPSYLANFLNQGRSPTTEVISRSVASGGPSSTFYSFEESVTRNFERTMTKRGGLFTRAGKSDIDYLHYMQRQAGFEMPRTARPGGALAGMDPLTAAHSRGGLMMESSYVQFQGMELLNAKDQARLIPSAVAAPGSAFDIVTGGKAEIKRLEYIGQTTRAVAQAPLAGGLAPIDFVRDVGGLDRTQLGPYARERQMLGRPERFVLDANQPFSTSAVQSTLGKGNAVRLAGQDLGFVTQQIAGQKVGLTGAINQMFIFQLGAENRLGMGDGMAYWGNQQAGVVRPFTKTVIDPHTVGRASSDLLNELIHRRNNNLGSFGVGSTVMNPKSPNVGKTIGNIDDFFSMFGGTKGKGAYLGEMDTGQIRISRYNDLNNVQLMIDESSEALGRGRYHISGGYSHAAGDGSKIFSLGFKGTTSGLTGQGLNRIFGRLAQKGGWDDFGSTFRKTGVDVGNVVVTRPDMMKKGADIVSKQMLSALGVFSPHAPGGFNMDNMYSRARSSIHNLMNARIEGGVGQQAGYWRGETGAALQQSRLLATAHFTASEFAKFGQGLTGKDMGAAFSVLQHQAKTYGLTEAEIDRAITAGFGGDSRVADVKKWSRGNVGVGMFSITPGPVASEYGAAMASMEPRVMQYLGHRVSNIAGFTAGESADFVTALLARKVGIEPQLRTLETLTRSVETQGAGLGKIADDVFYSGLPVVQAEELGARVAGSEAEARRFLMEHEKGFMIDFGDKRTAVGGLSRQFSGNRQIYQGGGDLLKSLAGHEIIRSGQNLQIEDEYIRRFANFTEDIYTVKSLEQMGSVELAEAQARVGNYRQATAQAWGQAARGVMAGKILGSGLFTGAGINLGRFPDVEIGKGQLKRLRGAFQSSGGSAIFPEGKAFLDALTTYMGGAQKALMARDGLSPSAAKRAARQETAEMAESFFTGMERRARVGDDRYKGVVAIAGRDPNLGPAHTPSVKAYRYDAGQGAADPIFRRFAETEAGQRALQAYRDKGRKAPRSFLDIANAIHPNEPKGMRQLRQGFFTSFVESLDSFGGVGGGRVFFPDMEASVHFSHKGNTPTKLNLGYAAAAMGDYDGDFMKLILKSPKKGLMDLDVKAWIGSHGEKAFTQAARVGIFQEEVKEGIKNLRSGGSALLPQELLFEGQLKEFYAKNIGKANTAFDTLRLGMIEAIASESDAVLAQQGFALLKAQQEVGVIAGKHLPRAIAFGDITAAAAMELIESGGARDASFNAMARQLMKGSGFATPGGLKVEGINVESTAGREVRKTIETAIRNVEGSNLDDVLAFIKRAGAAAHEAGSIGVVTQRRLENIAMQDTAQQESLWKRAITEKRSAVGAMARGDREGAAAIIDAIDERLSGAANNLGGAVGKMNRSVLGPVALGFAAAVGLSALSGDPGYAPKALYQPGEIRNQRVDQAISTGTLRNQHDRDHMPLRGDSLRPGMGADMIRRPINTQQSYFSTQNAYQIRGQVMSGSGAMGVSDFISSLGGSSAVRINDTRMPITPNYIDRIMGG